MSGAALSPIPVRVRTIRQEAADTRSIELVPASGGTLPACDPGCHVDIALPDGITRQYSLMATGPALESYWIAAKREPAGRGGSAFLHDRLQVGDALTIGALRNHFALRAASPYSVLIAGGIGITPILGMADHLSRGTAPWEIHYACRSIEAAAFLDRVMAFPNAHFYDDVERGGPPPIAEIVASAPAGADLYCCGPLPMIDAFEAAAAMRQDVRAHVERFTAAHEVAIEGGFTVRLARTGTELAIPAGKSILHALLDAGLDLPHSCEEGICGACETRVLEGEPDHRDSVLTQSEHATNKIMMICCSGARTPRLVLDL